MLQHEPQEIPAFESAIACFAGTAFHILKGDVAVLAGNDIFFREDPPVQIPRQVFQGGQAFSDMGAMDNPFSGHGFWWGKTFFVEGLEKSCAKQLGQGEGIEEVVCLFLFPFFSGLIHTAPRHDNMNMGVIIEAPVMSMQD